MVTRKPSIPPVATASSPPPPAPNGAPPYPATPVVESAKTASSVYSNDLNASPAFDLIEMNEARERQRRDSDISSHGTWASDDTNETLEDDELVKVEKPEPLNVKRSQQNLQKEKEPQKSLDNELPASLRPGPANGAVGGTKTKESRQYDEEAQSNPWQLESNNPYLQKPKQSPQQSVFGESSQKIWEQPMPAKAALPPPMHAPPVPLQAASPLPPVELPADPSPADELSRMSLGGRKSAGTSVSYETAEVLPVPPVRPVGQLLPPVGKASSADSQTFPSTNPWSDDQSLFAPPPPPAKEALSPVPPEHQYAHTPEPQYAPPPGPPPSQGAEPIYQPPLGPPPGSAGPLIDHEEPSQQPPLTVNTQATATASTAHAFVPETPRTIERKRSEHYQIKHIRWHDSTSGSAELRQSPILAQNLNGPCPLLALVNALVLSTPPNLDTPLIETLRTREQVSLGLLLDAVFDELMSGRRGDTAQALPDVSELYSFLLALHTGMNVNPRFVTPVTTPRGSYDGHPAALQSMHPSQRSQHKPGCFEETREMRLYSTFNIPLIHGWTAPTDTPSYAAFVRSAQTFEDAQNIQFAESELEHKARSEGLSFQEQQSLEDIQIIRSFLQTWPTQLTDYGLETISTSLKPGQIAILFRNDHFSTLYKEPRHGALMTLVTDAGYSSHEEIVWESLVDVNGAASEMFSGDFRVVSHGEDVRLNQGSAGDGNDNRRTMQGRDSNHQQNAQLQTSGSGEEVPPRLPGPRPVSQNTHDDLGIAEAQRTASEQEDHDLALALQLQEEEEEHHRQAEARRRREQELSEQFLSNEEQPPAIPPRRSGGRSPQTGSGTVPVTSSGGGRRNNGPQARPGVNRPGDRFDPDAPPTYEQSSSDRPYRPAGATAPPSQGNPLNALDALRRNQNGYPQQGSTSVNDVAGAGQGGRRRRQSQLGQLDGTTAPPYTASSGRVQGAANLRDTDERCAVM